MSRKSILTLIFLAALCLCPMKAKASGTGAVAIGSATIDTEKVNVTVSASDLPDSDDGKFYLFAEKVYQTGPAGAPVASPVRREGLRARQRAYARKPESRHCPRPVRFGRVLSDYQPHRPDFQGSGAGDEGRKTVQIETSAKQIVQRD